jgi:hypothetical protein
MSKRHGSAVKYLKVKFRSPTGLTAIGVIATLVLAVAVVMVLLRTGGSNALSDNAGLIGALAGTFVLGANTVKADLSGADLSGAVGITSEELEQQTKFLEDATMPNGLSYKDCLKDKESKGEKLTDRQKAHLENYKDLLKSKSQ